MKIKGANSFPLEVNYLFDLSTGCAKIHPDVDLGSSN